MRIDNSASADTFTKLIQNVDELPAPLTLTLLYLPLHLNIGHRGQHWHQASVQQLLAKCTAKKIEVVFEEQFDDWYVFQQISPDFRKRRMMKKVEE